MATTFRHVVTFAAARCEFCGPHCEFCGRNLNFVGRIVSFVGRIVNFAAPGSGKLPLDIAADLLVPTGR